MDRRPRFLPTPVALAVQPMVMLVVLGGCTVVTVPPPPTVPAAEAEVARDEGDADGDRVWVEPPAEDAFRDPILHSPVVLSPAFQSEVERWVGFWSGQEGPWFPTYLTRMSRYGTMVDRELEARDLPPSLRYVPLIESGYGTGAVSHASAVGMWQLMAPTARAFDLRVGGLVDERRDPVRATDVALRYLQELHDRFGSWLLALAAYNGGPTRVERLLAERAPGEVPSDEHFWTIRDALPRETRDFVPRLVAAARVAEAADAFGVAPVEVAEPFSFDTVTVPDATSLDVVAWAAGASEAQIAALNPHIIRGVTPVGVETRLRVPPGRGTLFAEAYARIPEDERVTIQEHVVARGETLWGIARQYGVALDTLEEANPRVRPERLQPGDRLLVPRSPRRTSR